MMRCTAGHRKLGMLMRGREHRERGKAKRAVAWRPQETEEGRQQQLEGARPAYLVEETVEQEADQTSKVREQRVRQGQ